MEHIHMLSNSKKQEELIRAYCAEAEALLAKAPDYRSAVQLMDLICARFHRECESSLVVAAIRLHLVDVLKHRWQIQGHVTNRSNDLD